LPVAYIDIRFCAHATEDLEKVTQAIKNILPLDHVEKIKFRQRIVDGHYGNPITFFETRIKDKEILKAIIENISVNLNSYDKKELKRKIDRCFEKGNLYIRLDKQAAFTGKIKFVISDPIRIRIKFKEKNLDEIINVCQKFGMLV
jgi:RNA binding exosome subunit